MRKKINQKKFPKEFQIKAATKDYQIVINNEKKVEKKVEKTDYLDLKKITEIMILAWRMNNKSNSYTSKNDIDDIKKTITNNIEDEVLNDSINELLDNSINPIKFMGKQSKKILKIFEESGFELKDYTNTKYHGGMAINVLAFETDENANENIITETIKPSIFYNNQMIFMGEVIVTTPKDE